MILLTLAIGLFVILTSFRSFIFLFAVLAHVFECTYIDIHIKNVSKFRLHSTYRLVNALYQTAKLFGFTISEKLKKICIFEWGPLKEGYTQTYQMYSYGPKFPFMFFLINLFIKEYKHQMRFQHSDYLRLDPHLNEGKSLDRTFEFYCIFRKLYICYVFTANFIKEFQIFYEIWYPELHPLHSCFRIFKKMY